MNTIDSRYNNVTRIYKCIDNTIDTITDFRDNLMPQKFIRMVILEFTHSAFSEGGFTVQFLAFKTKHTSYKFRLNLLTYKLIFLI